MRALVLGLSASLLVVAACAGNPPPDLADSTSGSTSAQGSTSSSGTGGSGSTGVTTGAGAGSDGHAYFDANVRGFTDSECAECHSSAYDDAFAAPDFLGALPGDYYGMLVGNINYVNASPGNSQFLTKGVHTGAAFTPDQAALVTTWLEIEAEERFGDPSTSSSSTGGNPTPLGPTAEEAVEAFGDCMTIEDWTASGIHAVASQNTLTDGPCNKCHQSGVGANYMTSPANQASIQDGFDNMRYGAPILKLITWTLDPATGRLVDVVQSERWQEKGGEGTGHPKYVLSSTYLQAIDDWFDLAYAKWVSGACGSVPDGLGGGGGGGAGGNGGGGGD